MRFINLNLYFQSKLKDILKFKPKLKKSFKEILNADGVCGVKITLKLNYPNKGHFSQTF